MRPQFGNGFRLYNQFAVFVYFQLQSILPDNFLGDISDWDKYITLNLKRTDLPFKTPDEFILNSDFHQLVLSSKLPRPRKFVERSIAFYNTFCGILLSHKIVTSGFIRGLSCFDSAVILEATEENYISCIELLTTHFVEKGWISSSEKTTSVSQYRSLVAKFRSSEATATEDWFHFLSLHYEPQNLNELHRLFKLASLCLPPLVKIPVPFVIPIPEPEGDKETFKSYISSVQMSYSSVPNVSSLYRDPRSINRVFRLLGRGTDLLLDRRFSAWNFLKGGVSKRQSLQVKMETAYKSAVISAEDLYYPKDTESVGGSRSSSTSSCSPGPPLNKATLSVPRCSETAAVQEDPKSKGKKGKKN